jgi:hypothetical protein
VLTCESVLDPIDDNATFTVIHLTKTRRLVLTHRVGTQQLDIGIAVLGVGFEQGDR